MCWNWVHQSYFWWLISDPPVNQGNSFRLYPWCDPIRKCPTDLGPDSTGAILSWTPWFFHHLIKLNSHQRSFQSHEDISSSMGTSNILYKPILACHVEMPCFRLKVMLYQLSIFHSCDYTMGKYWTNYSLQWYGTPHCVLCECSGKTILRWEFSVSQ